MSCLPIMGHIETAHFHCSLMSFARWRQQCTRSLWRDMRTVLASVVATLLNDCVARGKVCYRTASLYMRIAHFYYYYYHFWLLFNTPCFSSYSRFKLSKSKLFGFVQQVVYRPDALPVTQPTSSALGNQFNSMYIICIFGTRTFLWTSRLHHTPIHS